MYISTECGPNVEDAYLGRHKQTRYGDLRLEFSYILTAYAHVLAQYVNHISVIVRWLGCWEPNSLNLYINNYLPFLFEGLDILEIRLIR